MTTPMTIDAIFDAFLADQRERLSEKTYGNYERVIGLLDDCLNAYGPDILSRAELKRWEKAHRHDRDAFVHIFGAEKIIDDLGQFLGFYMTRKVGAGQNRLKAATTVTNQLTAWLHAEGLIEDSDAEASGKRAAGAARGERAANKLRTLLQDQARQTREGHPDDVAFENRIEERLIIERVETAALWLHGGIGPVAVPAAAAKLARPGWSVSITLARVDDRWRIIEVGKVYP